MAESKKCTMCGFETQDLELSVCPGCGEEDMWLVSGRSRPVGGESWELPPEATQWRFEEGNVVLAPYETIIERRKYGSVCRRCGHVIKESEDQTTCPICGHVHEIEKVIIQRYSPEERESRRNMSKEELVDQLKDIASHKVDAPYHKHSNAMCYSIRPPERITIGCDCCHKTYEIRDWDDHLDEIEQAVSEIRALGYQASVMRLCRDCARRQDIRPILLSGDAEADRETSFYLFAFRADAASDFTYSISCDPLDFRIVLAFLQNKTTFVYGDDIIHLRMQVPIIEYMTGLHLSGDVAASRAAIRRIAEKRECGKPRRPERGGELEKEPDRADEDRAKSWEQVPEEKIKVVMEEMAIHHKNLSEMGECGRQRQVIRQMDQSVLGCLKDMILDSLAGNDD